MRAFALFLGLLPTTALAAVSQCAYVGCRSDGDVGTRLLNAIGPKYFNVIIGIAVVSLAFGGVLLLFNFADEGNVERGKKAVLHSAAAIALIFLSQSIVTYFAALSPEEGDPVKTVLLAIMGMFYMLVNSVLVLAAVVGGYHMVLSQGNSEGFQKGFKILMTAAIGAFIVNAAGYLASTVVNIFT